MFMHSTEANLTHEQEQLLRETTINEDGPGSIVRDFENFLSFIAEQKLQLTKSYNLRLRYLRELNARLTTPLQLGLTRPVQKSYPHINGLYLLVRASGLTYIDDYGKSPILYINETAYQSWQTLNPTERYLSLLETWLTRAAPEIIGERDGPFGSLGNLRGFRRLVKKLSYNDKERDSQAEIESRIRYVVGDYNFGLVDLFGFIKTEFGPPLPKKGWYLKHVESTPFGDALLTLLRQKLKDNWFSFEEDENLLKTLQATLQPYFPESQNRLTITNNEAPSEGTHIFKVSLSDCWRRLAIRADDDLDTLAYAILRAVEFDNDHLYYFAYRDRFGMEHKIYHPYMEEGTLTNEVELGDLALHPGQKMTFLFDFGDHWEFNITLERLDTEMEIDEPTLLEAYGEAPEQYEYWDEEEWE